MNKLSSVVSLCAIALMSLSSNAAHAWGAQGHRLVAQLADLELTAPARAEVARLLDAEPEPTLSAIANWADQLRQHDRALAKRSAHWHYVNLGEHACDYQPARDCAGGNCVIAALTTQSRILADRTQPDAARRQALKYVVHMLGDIHQPLHAARADDKGGNRVQLRVYGHGSNLHALWDSGLLQSRQLSDEAYLRQLLTLPPPASDASAPLPPAATQWAQASCQTALTPGLYPASTLIDEHYVATWRPVAEAQLRLAGERLARILNASLDPH